MLRVPVRWLRSGEAPTLPTVGGVVHPRSRGRDLFSSPSSDSYADGSSIALLSSCTAPIFTSYATARGGSCRRPPGGHHRPQGRVVDVAAELSFGVPHLLGEHRQRRLEVRAEGLASSSGTRNLFTTSTSPTLGHPPVPGRAHRLHLTMILITNENHCHVTSTGRRPAIALALAAGAISGCAPAGGSGQPQVVASFYPLQYVAERVVGDHAEVTNLTAPASSRTTWSCRRGRPRRSRRRASCSTRRGCSPPSTR